MFGKVAVACLLGVLSVRGSEYGVDCSFPIHSKEFKCGSLLGDKKSFYEDYMEGCREFHGKKGNRCDFVEDDRIAMSNRQPQSMVNYTSTGFKKIRAPQDVMDLLTAYWELNRENMKLENWPAGSVYTNHWASPVFMVSVEDTSLRGGGSALKAKVWDAVRPTLEEWTGMELRPVSQYGIRAYTDGAVLNPHVDRLPLVSSCIINVAQDVDEPWPLEVYDRHDNAVNVTMEPGDMVLYESGSLIHGRPFPLKGRFFANIFIHFEPTGRPLGDKTNEYLDKLDDFYPPYLLPNSPAVKTWKEQNRQGWKRPFPSAPQPQYSGQESHVAAAAGDLDLLNQIASKDGRALHRMDENGWLPIHEAVRGGHEEAVRLLIQHGVDVDARAGLDGKGSSPLNVAIQLHSANHPVTKYLMQVGAKNIGPDEL